MIIIEELSFVAAVGNTTNTAKFEGISVPEQSLSDSEAVVENAEKATANF